MKRKVTLTLRDIVFKRNRGSDAEIQLSDTALQSAQRAGIDLQNSQWLLAAKNNVIGDKSTLSMSNDGLLLLRGGAVLAPLLVDRTKTRARQ